MTNRPISILFACSIGLSLLAGDMIQAQNSPKEREQRARERSERKADKIRDHRGGQPRELKPLSQRDKQNLDECVTLMIIGKSSGVSSDTKRLKIQGHDFKCKGMNTGRKYHKRVEYNGQLSRHLRARPDTQANYSFTLSNDGTIDKVVIKYGGIVSDITAVVKGRNRKSVGTSSTVKGWRGTANLVIETLVNRLSRSVKLAKSNRSRGQYEWGIQRAGKGRIGNVISLGNTQNRPIYCERICLKNRKCKAWNFTGRHNIFPPKCVISSTVNSAAIRQQSVSGVPWRR